MLIQFIVKNFTSFKDETVFSMLAGNETEKNDSVININDKDRLLKTTAIYGANASGKTNYIKAITAAVMMIRKSKFRNVDDLLIEMVPFKFSKKTINKPCEFEFVFIKDNKKYKYGFSADINRVHTEYLYEYLSAKPSLVFKRTNTNEYKFNQNMQSKLEELAMKNTEKKLFLSTATEWNYEKTKDAYMWFAKDIDTYNDYMDLSNVAFKSFEDDKDGKLKQFTINLLNNADIDIKDYNFEVEKINQEVVNFPLSNMRNNVVQKMVKVSTIHEIEDEDGNVSNYELDLLEESLGTNSLFFFSPIFKEAFENGKVIIIDEIDKSLHPLLVRFIITLFHNESINKNNAQLIFNTHDTNLLSLDLFRRDQIWFTQKDEKKGTTEIYPLDDFSVRKAENIQKGYLNGRYGAIPLVVDGDCL